MGMGLVLRITLVLAPRIRVYRVQDRSIEYRLDHWGFWRLGGRDIQQWVAF